MLWGCFYLRLTLLTIRDQFSSRRLSPCPLHGWIPQFGTDHNMADAPAVPFPGPDPSSIIFPISAGLVYYAHLYVAVITTLLAICSVLVGVRLFTRVKSAIGVCLDDWLIVVALVSPPAVSVSSSGAASISPQQEHVLLPQLAQFLTLYIPDTLRRRLGIDHYWEYFGVK